MDDGVVLRADVTRPALADGAPAPGKFPVVVLQGCYGKPVALIDSGYAKYEYVEVIVDVRGTGNSEGGFRALDARERKDSYDIVQWAAAQPWSNGKVGVAGFSYFGATADRTAEAAPPALARLVRPGRQATMNIEILATDWGLKPGHRLRLTVSGSDTPHIMPSLQSPHRFGLATVHRDLADPGFLTVPFRPVTG